jgi:hypothetical protein
MTIISSVGLRRITVDPLGHIWTIVTMFDRQGNTTFDLMAASTCVILYNGQYISQDVDDVPIYTVH